MVDIVVGVILLLIIGAAIVYIVRAKKKGTACIGCPAGGNCPHKKGSHAACGCSHSENIHHLDGIPIETKK